jgi:hypothetical protein
MPTAHHRALRILAPGESIGPSNFEQLFTTTVAGIPDTIQERLEKAPTDTTPHLLPLSDVCKLFAAHATTEDQLKLVMNTYERRLLAEYLGTDSSNRGGIALTANITYRQFFTAAIKLDLFKRPGFVSRILSSAEIYDGQERDNAARILKRAWTLALGEYLTLTEEEAQSPNYRDDIGSLPLTVEYKERAVGAAKELHKNNILFEEARPANFWRQFALPAARRTPAFLPHLVELAADPNIYSQIIWGKSIDQRLNTTSHRETSPAAVAVEYIRQLLLQYSKDHARNVDFIQETLRASAPEDRTPGGAPVTLFSLMKMVQFVDSKILELRREAREPKDGTYLVPPPLLVDDYGKIKRVHIDHSIVLRALSRLLYFTRQEKTLEPLVLQDELHAELAGILYYGMPKLTGDREEILEMRSTALRQARAGHLGALALTYPVPYQKVDEYADRLKNGEALPTIIRALASQDRQEQ